MYAGVGAWPPVWPVWANLFSVKSCVMVDKTVLRAAKLRVQNYFARIMQSLGMGWEVGFKAVTDIVQRKCAFSHG